MIGAPTRIFWRRIGAAVLSASIFSVLLISAGVAAALILFAPVARAQTGTRTVNIEYTVSTDYWSVEADLI